MAVLRARRNGKTEESIAVTREALRHGEHVHVVTWDGKHGCASHNPECRPLVDRYVWAPDYGLRPHS